MKPLRFRMYLSQGFSLAWRVRVKEYDVGFGVRERKQAKGGAIDEHIEDMRKIRVTLFDERYTFIDLTLKNTIFSEY